MTYFDFSAYNLRPYYMQAHPVIQASALSPADRISQQSTACTPGIEMLGNL